VVGGVVVLPVAGSDLAKVIFHTILVNDGWLDH